MCRNDCYFVSLSIPITVPTRGVILCSIVLSQVPFLWYSSNHVMRAVAGSTTWWSVEFLCWLKYPHFDSHTGRSWARAQSSLHHDFVWQSTAKFSQEIAKCFTCTLPIMYWRAIGLSRLEQQLGSVAQDDNIHYLWEAPRAHVAQVQNLWAPYFIKLLAGAHQSPCGWWMITPIEIFPP